MTKKVILTVLVSIILSLCCTFCFASTDSNTVGLGNEVSRSVNKGATSVGNMVDDVAGAGRRAVDDVGDAIGDMGNDMGRRMNSNNNGNYNTVRTSTEGNANMAGGMSTTSWMWIIFAIAAVIVVAAIWYYAMQGNDRS